MYKIYITETSRPSIPAKEKSITFNDFSEPFKTLEDVKAFITERYGKIPRITNRNKVYRDRKDGTSKEVGFIYSYWNSDVSHNSKKWYQTDWIEITKYIEEPIDIKTIM